MSVHYFVPSRGFPPKIPIVIIPLSVVEVSRPKVMSWWVEFRVILLWQGWFSHLIKLSRLPICTVSTESYLAQITNCQLSFKRYGSVINPIPYSPAQVVGDWHDRCVLCNPTTTPATRLIHIHVWILAICEKGISWRRKTLHTWTTSGELLWFSQIYHIRWRISILFISFPHSHFSRGLQEWRMSDKKAWVVGVVELSVKVSEWANIHNNSIHTSFYFLSRGFSFLFCDGPRRELLQYYCCDWNNSEIKIGSANERVLSQGIALA